MPDEPCRCWSDLGSVVHAGHCCFLTWPSTDPVMPCGHDTPERVAKLRALAAATVFPRQTCPHCLGEHPGVDCPEPSLFDEETP